MSIPRRAPFGRFSAIFIGFSLLFAAPAALAQDERIMVVVDQAKLVKLPDRVATLVIGNPMIADVSLQTGGIMVVTGKGYGSTNLIAMDRAGNVISERDIEVKGGGDKLVTVFRGTERESYSCTPACERRVTLGDTSTYFKTAVEQSDALNAQASGAMVSNGPPAAK